MLRTIALAGLLAFAASAVIAQAPSGALSAAAAECDRLAASAYDPDATAPGVDGNDIEHARAVPACEAAVAQHPEIPRLAFQLARVYGAAWRESDAARLYRKAADNGYVPAMNDLGYCYNEGRGLPIDKVEAVRWFRLGAGNGDVRSMDDLGTAYLDGAGVGSNAAEAMRWFRQAADRGYGPSMHSIGTIYQLGLGVTKDNAEAERWFRQAAQWYRQAAGKGAAFAMAGMGFIQQSGQGEPRDDDEAIRWFRRAAEKGNSAGMLGLGFMYTRRPGRAPRRWRGHALVSAGCREGVRPGDDGARPVARGWPGRAPGRGRGGPLVPARGGEGRCVRQLLPQCQLRQSRRGDGRRGGGAVPTAGGAGGGAQLFWSMPSGSSAVPSSVTRAAEPCSAGLGMRATTLADR